MRSAPSFKIYRPQQRARQHRQASAVTRQGARTDAAHRGAGRRPDAVVQTSPTRSAAPAALITLDLASVGYAADTPILQRLNLRIDPDDRIALLGRNGNGKTTLAACSRHNWRQWTVR